MLEVKDVSKHFGGIRAVSNASLHDRRRRNPRADRPERRRQDHAVQPDLRASTRPTAARIRLNGREIQGVPSELICHRGLARSFQITNLFRGLSIYENLRLSLQAQSAGRFNLWRDIDSYPDIHAETAELIKFLGLEGIETDRRRRTVLWRAAAGRSRHRARLQAAGAAARRAAGGPRRRRTRARLEPGQERRRQHSGADRRARHRPRARLLASRSP